jgi:hypothetical protein
MYKALALIPSTGKVLVSLNKITSKGSTEKILRNTVLGEFSKVAGYKINI